MTFFSPAYMAVEGSVLFVSLDPSLLLLGKLLLSLGIIVTPLVIQNLIPHFK